MKRRTILGGLPALGLAATMSRPVRAEGTTLTVGYEKVGHLAPIIAAAEELKKTGMDIKLVEFVRYADARTALLAGSLDVAAVGPADLAISLAHGSNSMIGIMGVGASPAPSSTAGRTSKARRSPSRRVPPYGSSSPPR